MSFSPLFRQRIATAVLAVALLTALAARALAQQAVPTVPNAFALTPHAADHDGVDALLHSFDKRIDFTENRGQFGPGVLYRADFPLGQAVATPTGMVISTFDPASVNARAEEGERLEKDLQDGKPFRPMSAHLKGHAWAMDFVNSAPGMRVSARKPHGDPRNYFGATAARTAANVRSYQEVWYENVYDRVDVRYYPAEDGTLEYDVVCKPGSDPGAIAIRFTGIARMELNAKGGLVLHTSVGDVELPAPVVYQRIGGRQRNVDARYEVRGNVLRFRLGAYDREQPLVIDPIALRWATWVNTNSTGDNHGHCIWVDPSDGAIYVVARVVGTTDQITPGAFDNSANGNLEMIVGKYTEPASIGQAGTRVWQTYIGGSGDDNPYAMEQGPDGNLYITGYTSSANYPLLGGSAFSGSSYDQRAQASNNIFITKINTAGNSIKSAVIGGNGDDGSFDVRIDNAGDLVVCGNTRSTNLATLYSGSGASNTNNGDVDVVVFKLNADLSALSWMKNYGGSGVDQATIMLQNNTSGDIFVGGYTTSTNFPTVSPRQSTRGGSQAGFLQRLTSAGAVSWSSYFQAANSQSASILCMEFNTAKDQIYFGGVTSGLAASNVSASGAYDNSQNGSNDFYVCRMGIDQTFVKSTYLGGTNNEVNMMGLNTDQNNDVYVFGYTNSTNFPVTATPNTALQSTNQGSNDKTFTKLSADLDALLFSTYYGGTQDDYDPVGERGIKFSNCRIYTIVTSRSTNLPLTQGALNTTKNSGTGTYEPGLVVWANPPDLLGNTILGNQSVCAGSVPGDITGSVPAYVLPTISRNNASSSYPAIGSAASYQWQISTDSLTWSDIPGATAQNLSGSLIGVVNAKTYVRRVIGGDACILAGAADQVVTVKLIGVTAQVQQVSCNGFGDGTITAICDGVAPFSYAWSNGQTTQTATGLAPGDYTVTVTDHNGCTATGTFTMTQPAVLGGSTSTTPATCGNANGTASVSVNGGTTPYTYLWSEGSTTAAIGNLAGGGYSVTVTDGHGCILQRNAAVDATTVPNVSAGADLAITCATGPSILLNGSSSTPGVSYSWTASNGGHIASGAGSATPTVDAAGTYTLTVTNTQTGCSANDAMVVTLDLAAPNASASAGGTLTCAVTSVMLNGGSTTPNATFAWTGPNGFTSSDEDPMVSAPGTYVLTVTAPNGCTSTANAQVGQNIAVPNASAQGGTVTCATPSTMLNGGSTTPNVTFAWTGPNGFTSNDEDPVVSAAGTYILTVTAQNGCTNTAPATVVEDVVTIEASAQGGTLTCSMPMVTLHGSSSVGGVTYAWTGPNGFTSNDQDPVVNTAGQYDLTVTAQNGCMGTASALVDMDRATPNANASGDVITCSTPMVMLNGGSTTPNVTFAWTGPNGFTSNDEDPLVGEAGSYLLTVTAANGCTNTASATVTLDNEAPGAQATGGTLTCNTTSVMLMGSGNGTFAWTGPNGFTSNEQNPVVTAAGTYSLVVTGENGCSSQASAQVILDNEVPGAQATGGTLTCNTTSVMLMGSGNGTFAWTGPNGFASNEQNPVVTAAGTYTLVVTGENGCSSQASAQVILDNEVPGAQATGGTLTCANTSVMLMGSGNGTFAWTGPNGFTSNDQNPVVTAPGTYTLIVTGENGCSSQASAQVILDNEVPGAQATGGTLTCNTTSVMLMGSGNGTFAWTGPNGFTSNEQNPVVTAAGTYTLVVTGENGCSSQASAQVILDNEVPGAQATGGTLTCNTTSVMLMGSGNGTFAWTGPNGFTSNEQNPVVTAAGTYSLVVTGENGCSSQASAQVILNNEVPGAQATGGTLTCANTSVMLMGSGNGTFAWTGPNGFTSNDQNPVVTAAGTYTLVVTGENGCSSQASAQVILDNEVPGAQATGGTLTCANTSVMLMGSGNGTFAWTGPNGFASSEQNPVVTAAGTYTLVVTGENGCSSQASAQVILDNEVPGAQATGGTLTCNTTSVMLMGSGNGTFAWTGPNGFTSNEQNPTVTAAGTYTLVVTGENGCSSQASAQVILDNEVPGAQATGGVLTCNTTSVMLMGSGNGTFAWSGPNGFASNEQNPVVTAAGTYTLVVTGENGCSSQASTQVTLDNNVPDASATGGVIDCNHIPLLLDGSSTTAGVSFAWSGPNGFSANTEDVSVILPGAYTFTVTAANGCMRTVPVDVTMDATHPDVTAEGGVLDCAHPTVMLTGGSSSPNVTFLWRDGSGFFSSTDPDPVVDVPGFYTLAVTGENGCTAYETVAVTADFAVPNVSAAGGMIMCEADGAQLNGGSTTAGATFHWTSVDGFQSNEEDPFVTQAGFYTLTVTGPNGCSADSSVVVIKETCTGCDGPLIIACARDTTVECGSSLEPLAIGEPVVRKILTCPAPNYASWHDDFSGGCPTILTRTWTIGDESGHFESCVQTVTIEDHIAPTLMNVPADITVGCGEVPENAGQVWAEDACKKKTTEVIFTEHTEKGACAGSYKVLRTWTSTDACGNTATATQVINVVDDAAPVLYGVPDAVTVECGGEVPPADVWAEDGCDPQVEVDYEETMIPGNCPGAYSLVRIWSATDACGNTATASQLVSMVDTQAPVLTCVPEDMTVPCDGIPAAIPCKAMDACAGEVDVTMTEESTGSGCIDGYAITRTYTATDACGNTVTQVQTITVEGSGTPTGVDHVANAGGTSVDVWPNPFHTGCTLQFTAAHGGKAHLDLVDARGRLVAVLFSGDVNSGRTYTLPLDRNGLATGVYLYRLTIGNDRTLGRVIAD